MEGVINKLKQASVEVEEAAAVTEAVQEPRTMRRAAKRNWLYGSLDFSRWIHHQTIIRNLPFIFFIAALGIIYIYNAHYMEKNVREADQIEKQLQQLRWDYMTSKSELENLSKQSEVAKMAAPLGLQELREPPMKIQVAAK